MCEPVTLGIMAGVAVVGAGIQTYSAIRQGEAQSAIAEMNAKFANQQATNEILVGEAQAEAFKAKAGQFQGTQKAEYAASGVDVTSGSALDVLADTRLMSDQDAQKIKDNASRRAYADEVSATGSSYQAQVISDSTKWEAAGTLLGGAARGASYAYQGIGAWKKNGGSMFPTGG